jgi:hypothetical protein
MDGATPGWLLLLVGFIAANVPFFSERVLLVGPRPAHKAFGWRLLELLLLSALTVGLGMLVEGRIGQRQPQGWEFYAVVGCLMLTFAFPGFVWRHLRRGAHGG